jgi:hypothetical protein
MSRRGFVYVATGAGYLEEAVRSAESLKRAMPKETVCVVTDQAVSRPCFDIVVPANNAVHGPVDKLLAIDAPLDRAIFLDTDTYVVSDLTDVFEVLDRCDLGATLDTRRGWDYSLPGLPKAFSEFTTGMVAFNINERTRAFFAQWRANFEKIKPLLSVPNADQPSFRLTLYESDLRCASIPSEYHFVADTVNYVMWDARMIHARGNYEEIEQQVNSILGPRVYIPNVGVFQGYAGGRSMLRECGRFLKNAAKLMRRPPEDVTKKTPVKWW